jgi:DNA-binding response OmpR family regulator
MSLINVHDSLTSASDILMLSTRPGQKPRVLAVDDELINRMILEDLLQSHLEVITLDSGQACLTVLQDITPDLILLDVNMPHMNGFEVCRWLKAQPQFQRIPVIFLTAKITDQDQQLGLSLGAVDYITKPFTESILLARIQTHLRLSYTTQMLAHAHAQLLQERGMIERIMQTLTQDQRFISHALRSLIMPLAHTSGEYYCRHKLPMVAARYFWVILLATVWRRPLLALWCRRCFTHKPPTMPTWRIPRNDLIKSFVIDCQPICLWRRSC